MAHFRFAQRGRRFAWSAVGGFVFVMLTFWGVYMLSGIHNPPKAPSPPETAAVAHAPGADAAPGFRYSSIGVRHL